MKCFQESECGRGELAQCFVADATVWRRWRPYSKVRLVVSVVSWWSWIAWIEKPLCCTCARGHVRICPDQCPLMWPCLVVSVPLS